MLDDKVNVFFGLLDGAEALPVAVGPFIGWIADKYPDTAGLLPNQEAAIFALESHPVHN